MNHLTKKNFISNKMTNNANLWKIAHQHLKTTQMLIERGFIPTSREKEKILKLRAGMLAQKPQRKKINKITHLEILEFVCSRENYGIESIYIREVCHLKKFTSLPCTPKFIFGIINLRGQIISVIDIKILFGFSEKTLTNHKDVIIIHTSEMEFGILADSITGMRSVSLEKIQLPDSTLTKTQKNYLRGVTKEQLMILDAAKMLSSKKIIISEKIQT